MKKNWYLFFVGGLLLLQAVVFLIFRENSYLAVHDNLDLFVTQLKMMKNTDSFFAHNAVIPMLGGISRDNLGSEFSLYNILYYILPNFWAYMAGYVLKIAIGIVSFCLLAKDVYGEKYDTYAFLGNNGKITVMPAQGIKLTWGKITGAAKYEVYRSTDGGSSYSLLKSTTGTSLTNTSTEVGKTYYYKVRAVTAGGTKSAFSSIVSRTCDLPRPALTVTLNSEGNPKLSWTKVDGALEYEVYRSTNASSWSLLKTTSGTGLTNTSVTAGTKYYYRVRAIHDNSSANSAYSSYKSITAE